MNSPQIPAAVVQVEGELLRFDHPDQWRSRPGWREKINLSEHNLARIVGGYNLAKEHWQHCGLCNTLHGKGYVVGTKEGLETQIGKDCGQRHLGAVFEELERRFTIALEAQDRMQRLRDLLVRRGELLGDAKQALDDCDRASASVYAIVHKISREPALDVPFRKNISADGDLFFDRRVSDDEFEVTKRRYARQVVGRVDGHRILGTTSPRARIKEKVVPVIFGLSEEMLSNLTQRSLAAKSKEADEASSILIDAKAYVELARRFTARKNWQAFASLFGADRLKTNDRGRRILQQLIEQGRE